ncbi:type II secretion system F family protein [Clostridium lacusfryxellense]|uniref:type II secretion system F family protein n=1 Tax=Clostridium lacusfryxellense TaxID=205328 RepID=UPI001C0B206F|nr:type II secretion system F family protein [Clostridium lacusfryxellense]MBU3112340.1 type II secretion system F family protein [Clostridium lacusfryxellense]
MNLLSIIMLSIGTILFVLYIIILNIGSSKYSEYIDNLPDKEHFLKGMYPVGFYVLDKIKYRYSSKLDRKRLKETTVIFGEKYARYYLNLNYAQKVSVGLFILPFGFLFYSLVNNGVIFILDFVFMACAFWYYDMLITDIISKRNSDIDRDLPNIISKLTLLVNAGMILSEAWIKVSTTGNSTIYEEMRKTTMEIQNGTSEIEAYMNFSDRCMKMEVTKFISTLVQNITKGNKELVTYLKDQTKISWEEKKHNVRRQGEKASSKLLIPISITFIGILIMIVVPIFANFSM